MPSDVPQLKFPAFHTAGARRAYQVSLACYTLERAAAVGTERAFSSWPRDDPGSGLIEAALDRPVEPRFLRSLW